MVDKKNAKATIEIQNYNVRDQIFRRALVDMEFLYNNNKINYSILIVRFLTNKELNLQGFDNYNTYLSEHDTENNTYIYYRFTVQFLKYYFNFFSNFDFYKLKIIKNISLFVMQYF